eukprot:1996266-Amphidinium_carterae.2
MLLQRRNSSSGTSKLRRRAIFHSCTLKAHVLNDRTVVVTNGTLAGGFASDYRHRVTLARTLAQTQQILPPHKHT